MLDDTQPSTMEELIRISGLSHGTDVWLGNAQDIIRSGTAKLNECVCCRDDIMNYLIDKGVEPKLAFTTMEAVRKGKGLKPEMEQAMMDHDVAPVVHRQLQEDQVHVPQGPCRGLCDHGPAHRLVQGALSPGVLCLLLHRARGRL